jgi:RimJ/RimL family protein N-acetyltransferase
VDSSLEHLRPWMPWTVNEPQTLAEKVELLRHFRGQFDLDQDYIYAILSRDESKVVGGTGLHRRRGPGALEIGYWIRVDQVGHGLGTEAAAALTRVAFELTDVDRVEIRIDPTNDASRSIPRKLGYVEDGTLRGRLEYPERRDVVIYSLFREEYAGSPATAVALDAFDAAGRRVLP